MGIGCTDELIDCTKTPSGRHAVRRHDMKLLNEVRCHLCDKPDSYPTPPHPFSPAVWARIKHVAHISMRTVKLGLRLGRVRTGVCMGSYQACDEGPSQNHEGKCGSRQGYYSDRNLAGKATDQNEEWSSSELAENEQPSPPLEALADRTALGPSGPWVQIGWNSRRPQGLSWASDSPECGPRAAPWREPRAPQ